MTKFGNRLRELRAKARLSQQGLADILKITKSSLNMYERGEREPSIATLELFADYFNVDMDYLLGNTDHNTDYSFLMPDNVRPVRQAKFRPLLGVIACGDPILADENIETYIPVPQDIRCDFVLTCKGDSMRDAGIYNGDYVYLRKQDIVDNGEIAAVLIANAETEATLKRVYIDVDRITLMPCNSTMPPMIYTGEQALNVRILGKAVAVTHKL